MSTRFPYLNTSGCFLHISHPMCAKKKPREMLCGSAFESLYLWWTLWSRTHSMTLFCSAIVWKTNKIPFNFLFALYDLWHHRRWAPAAIPQEPVSAQTIAAKMWPNYEEKLWNRKLTDPPRAGFSWNVKTINSHRMQHNEKQNISPNNLELVRFFSDFHFVRIFAGLVELQGNGIWKFAKNSQNFFFLHKLRRVLLSLRCCFRTELLLIGSVAY